MRLDADYHRLQETRPLPGRLLRFIHNKQYFLTEEVVLLKASTGGAWAPQSVKRLPSGFGSGSQSPGIQSRRAPCSVGTLLLPLLLPPPPPPACALSNA